MIQKGSKVIVTYDNPSGSFQKLECIFLVDKGNKVIVGLSDGLEIMINFNVINNILEVGGN